MKLRTPPKRKINTNTTFYKDLNDKIEDFEYIFILNNLFEQIEFKIEKIKDMIIYEILEIKTNPKEYRRTLKRNNNSKPNQLEMLMQEIQSKLIN